MKKYMRIHKNDNVAVMLYDAKPGDVVELDDVTVTLNEDIPYGHKVALRDFKTGDHVIKYNQPIGYVTADAKKGDWLHIHNIKSLRGGFGK
ncbi:MAG: UxaA family hydrolase [Oscillospiraceae bacterium]